MRLYEFSKQINVSAKELLDVLHKGGFEIKSHMSVLGDDAINFLKKKYTRAPLPAQTQIKPPQQLQKEPLQQKTTKNDVRTHDKKVVSPVSVISAPAHGTEQQPKPIAEPSEIIVEPMSVARFAAAAGKSINEVIVTLLKWRVIATKNQLLPTDVVYRLAEHYALKAIKPVIEQKSEMTKVASTVAGKALHERLPIIVVLGHVDHGKTTLLDYIRKTRVAAREKGGITQHLGAYEATTAHGNVVFLDTPGHEAFYRIRQRGVKVADIAVLVVAADDGVMPQTVEVIKHIKAMGVPIVVAINKVDKVDQARLEVIKRQLAQYDVLPEEWGGNVICVPISAKTGLGVDRLLEMIVLQSDVMELRTDIAGPARGYVLEAKIERGRGVVATLICQQGTVHVGDYFSCGKTGGRINSLVDSFGKRIQEAGPSIPVQIAGLDELPEAGDFFSVISKQEYLKLHMAYDTQKSLAIKGARKENYVNIIVKTDTNSSKEALLESIDRLSKQQDIGFHIVYAGIGDVSERDIELAYNIGARIIGLHVKTETNAVTLAQQKNITINLYDIIYKLLEVLEQEIIESRPIEMVRTKIGEAVVRKVFDIPKVGIVAGSYVKEGRFSRDGVVVIWRGRQKIGEGKIISLQREKKSVKEVHAGFECGFVVAGINDWAIDDRVECFVDLPKKT